MSKKKKFPIWIPIVAAVAILGVFVTIKVNTYLKEKKGGRVKTAVVEPEILADETRKGYKNLGNDSMIDIFNKERGDSLEVDSLALILDMPETKPEPEKAPEVKTPAPKPQPPAPAANALSSSIAKQEEKPAPKPAPVKRKVVEKEVVKFNFTVVKEDPEPTQTELQTDNRGKKTEELDLTSFSQGKIYGEHMLKHNEPVNLRSTERIMIGRNKYISEGALLYGVCQQSQNRMKIRITRAMTPQGNFPVDITVYDSYDFQEGIFIQGRHIDVQPEEGISDVAEEVTSVMPNQLIGTSVKTASKLMQRDVKKMKKASIKVPDSYVVYFRVNESNNRNR